MNKSYILIQNDGEIESNSFELIGASTKRNDNTKIGFFGSGLKYSIAFMMRNNIDFKIFSGLNEIKFSTSPEMLKDSKFERICINGKPTSYTTTMGPTWSLQWFVLREIYCNAIDEGSCQMVKETVDLNPQEGKTRIYIELTETLKDVVNNWNAYFSDERTPLFITDKKMYTSYLHDKVRHQQVKVYKKTKGVLYRKGVLVYENKNYQYDYELENIEINEDRTAKSSVAFSYCVVGMMASFVNEEWVLSVLRNSDSFEYKALIGSTSDDEDVSKFWIDFSKNYLLVARDRSGKYAQRISESKKEHLLIPDSFAFQIKKELPQVEILGIGKITGNQSYEEIEPTSKMKFLMKTVEDSLREMGYENPYHVKYADFSDENILGKADIESKTIFMANTCFDLGRREIALTLMEEVEHIRSKCGDETREFQNHIFSKWLSYMEEKSALFL